MPVTVLDVIVIVVVLISAVLAMVRGFVREVLSVASWVAAAAAAYFLYKPVLPLLANYIESKTVATIAAAAAIFFVALIVATYITMKISDFVIDSRIGAVDRAFGFIFGAVRGILLLVIALWFFNFMVSDPTKRPAWVVNARTGPFLVSLGERLQDALPKDADVWVQGLLHSGGDASPPPDGEAPPDAEVPADDSEAPPPDPAYPNGERQGLDQLIENNPGKTQGQEVPGD